MSDKLYDVIIIGSGPAGLTAAIYSSRAMVDTLVITGSFWGGQLMLSSEVENYPGFIQDIQGPNLMESMRKQVIQFGAELLYEDVTDVDFSSRFFRLEVGNRTFEGGSVIIATGSTAKWLGLDSEVRLRGKGVSSCATCDAFLFKDKRTTVVGGGDTAIEEALTLSRLASKVTVIHRRDKLRATQVLQARANVNDKIEFIWDTVVEEILGTEKVEGLRLKNLNTGETSELSTDAIFVAIGYKPNTHIFRGKIELDDKGYVVVNRNTETSVAGVFAAGDVVDFRYRQAITAAGSGCKAALDAIRYLHS